MNEILVTIYVLGLEDEFDLFLPIGISMREAIDMIQKVLVELSNGNYVISENPILYSQTSGKLINLNNIVKFSGLKNGCKVILK